MKQVDNKYKCLPFWSWNDELDEKRLCDQIEWMNKSGIGGFFMHARGGLKTEYLGEKWFSCVKVCEEKAEELGMEAYAYDENGWPSGFAGGKLLEDIENHDMYLTTKNGEYDKKAIASFVEIGDELVRVYSGENCLNVYLNYSTSTADICNPKVVDKFISLTHEEYKKRDTGNLRGFFTDEPQYYRWGISYTKVLVEYFKEHYGYDIFDKIGLLFVNKKGYEKFRYEYWSAMQDLLLNNFSKKIYDWCDENNYKLTGHYVEEVSLFYQMMCCGGVMPFYEYEHIPGMDKLCRSIEGILAPKQLGSAASQLGKKQVLTETFAMCGWDVTPKELKKIAESQYVFGVNLMCQHLLPYSEYGQRKRDYPAHFSDINPWVKENFKEFNDYFSVLGYILSNSTEIVNVGLLHNIKSAYINYDKNDESTIQELENSIQNACYMLSSKQIPFHFLDETLLRKHGKVNNNIFECGLCKYDFIILPKVYLLEKSTDKLLREYVNNGGKILLLDDKPYLLEGEKANFDYLFTNTSIEEIQKSLPYVASENKNIRSAFREDNEGRKYIYVVNVGDNNETITFDFKDYSSFESYDILNDKYHTIGKTITLQESESLILYLSNKEAEKEKELNPLALDGEFIIKDKVENNLTIDYLSYSKDGKEYSEKYYYMGLFDKLLKERYKGKLYLKYSFNVKEIPNNCKLVIEKTGVVDVTINNKKPILIGESRMDKGMVEYNLEDIVLVGENEVILELNWYQGENVYYALFGENVTESLKNCLAYDTNIEPIYIMGDFGVEGTFINGKNENIILGENFSIVKQNEKINNLITDGFPFFFGMITVIKKINLDNINYKFAIKERFHLIKVTVNGKFVGNVMLNDSLNLKEYLHIGENTIELTICVGLRNAYGPFHTPEQENIDVQPFTFERPGEWIDGKCSKLRDNYSFVKNYI